MPPSIVKNNSTNQLAIRGNYQLDGIPSETDALTEKLKGVKGGGGRVRENPV